MKKRFLVLAAIGVLVVGLMAPAAFGAGSENAQNAPNQQFFNQMFDWHQQWLDQAQKAGQITTDQAKAWQDHFSYMRDFHNKYGFGGMMGNFNGGGFGGMMGGFYNNSAQPQ